MTRASLLLAVLVSLGAASALPAQSTGHVTGRVIDGRLLPMPGVSVTLTNRAGRYTAVTDSVGAFTFERVPPGRALVVATQAGYGATRRYELAVRPNSEASLEITLYAITPANAEFFDPEFNRPLDFSHSRGFSIAVLGNVSNATLAIGEARAGGSGSAFRVELGQEFDSRWMLGVRGGYASGSATNDVNFRYSASNTFTYRDYHTRRLDLMVRYSPLRNNRTVRPFGSASFGTSRFTGGVRVSSLQREVDAAANGIVLTFGGGLQVVARPNLALDIGAEWSGTSFEEWRLDDGVIGLPNLKVFGTDFVIAARWWPRANRN